MELVTSKLKISVPNPCNQMWEDMDPSRNGRYCQHCEKEVVDFTGMSNMELEAWFSTAKGKVCGHFDSSQLNANKLRPTNNWKIIMTKVLAFSFLTFGADLGAKAIANEREKISCHEKKYPSLQIEIQQLGIFRIDSTVIVKGKISSSNDKLPLVGIKISHKNGNESLSSNEKGNFLIKIQIIADQKIILVFSHTGFEIKEVEINDSQVNPVNIVANKVEGRMTIAGGAVAIIKRIPWYKRIWYHIKRVF